jgi:hypothetical protein
MFVFLVFHFSFDCVFLLFIFVPGNETLKYQTSFSRASQNIYNKACVYPWCSIRKWNTKCQACYSRTSRNLEKLNMFVFLEFYFLFGSFRFWFIFVHGNETPEYQTCFSRASQNKNKACRYPWSSISYTSVVVCWNKIHVFHN